MEIKHGDDIRTPPLYSCIDSADMNDEILRVCPNLGIRCKKSTARILVVKNLRLNIRENTCCSCENNNMHPYWYRRHGGKWSSVAKGTYWFVIRKRHHFSSKFLLSRPLLLITHELTARNWHWLCVKLVGSVALLQLSWYYYLPLLLEFWQSLNSYGRRKNVVSLNNSGICKPDKFWYILIRGL
jgi:hypothetical protein